MLFNERNRLAQFGRAAEEHLYDVGSNPALFLFTFIQHKIKKGESYKIGEKETRLIRENRINFNEKEVNDMKKKIDFGSLIIPVIMGVGAFVSAVMDN